MTLHMATTTRQSYWQMIQRPPFMQTVLSVQEHCFIDSAWTVGGRELKCVLSG